MVLNCEAMRFYDSDPVMADEVDAFCHDFTPVPEVKARSYLHYHCVPCS